MNLKKGISQLATLAVIFSILVLLASPVRRYIYWTYQQLGIKIGINFNNIASQSYVRFIKAQSGELEKDNQAIFLNRNVAFKDAVASQRLDILGESTAAPSEKWIEIDLSDQRLNMKEGDTTVGSFLISSGKWAPPPQGEWRVWTKLRYTRMTGGSKALG